MASLVAKIVFLVMFCLWYSQGIPFIPCKPGLNSIEKRELYVATCDTRAGWKEFHALKVWNITSSQLRNTGLSTTNVCQGRNWGLHGFLTKPLLYLDYINTLPRFSKLGGDVHIILMDSDTFWSADMLSTIWNNYDCARMGKSVVVSTEMSCWIGRYCTPADIQKWYNNSGPSTPSYSPFLNSGVIMGTVVEVARMLDYVIKNKDKYFITYVKHKFDDQYAIGDYAINVAPNVVALDYHQQLSASCSIHTVGNPPDDGWPFVCKSRSGAIQSSCRDFTTLLSRRGHFKINETTCMAYRTSQNVPESEELETLSPRPIIWHGNGAGKRAFLSLAHSSYQCFLKKFNMTENEYYLFSSQ